MMRRTTAIAFAILGLGILAVSTVRIQTDARMLLGEAAPRAEALETGEGLRSIGTITGGTAELRAEIAREMATAFADSPLVDRIRTGPGIPDTEVIDLLWRQRFILAPPNQDSLTRTAMAEELRDARDGLTSLSTSPLAPRFLTDPTGSFRRLIATLSSAQELALDNADGGFRSADGTAAILFIELSQTPFDPVAHGALDSQMQSFASERGTRLTLVGLRSISARISGNIEARAQASALVGGGLVFVWLIFVLRGIRGFGTLLLPVASAFVVAVLATQILFGGIHVIALGFGGALLGLSVDYPLHLMCHAGTPRDRQRALGLIRLGALTTAATFLALIGAGLEIMGQIGVFAASGLLAAAAVCHALAREAPAIAPHLPAVPEQLPRLRGKLVLLASACLVLGGTLLAFPPQIPQRLMQIPAPVREDVAAMDALLGLPSGRYAVETVSDDIAELLALQSRLLPVLHALEAEGALGRSLMLADILPPRGGQPATEMHPAMQANITDALADAGLDPAFSDEILREYARAAATPALTADAFSDLKGRQSLSGLLVVRDGRLLGPTKLWDVHEPDRVAAAIAAIGTPDIRWTAPSQQIAAHLNDLTRNALVSVAIGGTVALLLLLIGLRGRRIALEIALTVVTAVLATTVLISLTGGLGIFHVLALVLVIGIGIDYGLFLATCQPGAETRHAVGSILLCAMTTALAFAAMALSGVEILGHIAITVLSGLILTLLLYGIRSGGKREN